MHRQSFINIRMNSLQRIKHIMYLVLIIFNFLPHSFNYHRIWVHSRFQIAVNSVQEFLTFVDLGVCILQEDAKLFFNCFQFVVDVGFNYLFIHYLRLQVVYLAGAGREAVRNCIDVATAFFGDAGDEAAVFLLKVVRALLSHSTVVFESLETLLLLFNFMHDLAWLYLEIVTLLQHVLFIIVNSLFQLLDQDICIPQLKYRFITSIDLNSESIILRPYGFLLCHHISQLFLNRLQLFVDYFIYPSFKQK